ncbi:MAG: hypothetical protein LRY51_04705 [Geovibrio sp.]|nr:hypothetical protein [Geovibrio sp.]
MAVLGTSGTASGSSCSGCFQKKLKKYYKTAEYLGFVAVTLISRFMEAEQKHEFLVSEAKAPPPSACPDL